MDSRCYWGRLGDCDALRSRWRRSQDGETISAAPCAERRARARPPRRPRSASPMHAAASSRPRQASAQPRSGRRSGGGLAGGRVPAAGAAAEAIPSRCRSGTERRRSRPGAPWPAGAAGRRPLEQPVAGAATGTGAARQRRLRSGVGRGPAGRRHAAGRRAAGGTRRPAGDAARRGARRRTGAGAGRTRCRAGTGAAGGGSGAAGGAGGGGRKSSGLRYACFEPASRTPKWRWGASTERRPLVPTAPEHLAGRHLLPLADRNLREVEVRGVEGAVRGSHRDRQAGRAGDAREAHRPGGGGRDRGAHLRRDVDPPVLPRRVGVGAVAVGSDHLTDDRPLPRVGSSRCRAEAAARGEARRRGGARAATLGGAASGAGRAVAGP